jgi:hypothetical protein
MPLEVAKRSDEKYFLASKIDFLLPIVVDLFFANYNILVKRLVPYSREWL